MSKWRKRYFEERLAGLAERPRTGRRRLFPPALASRSRRSRVSCPRAWAAAVAPVCSRHRGRGDGARPGRLDQRHDDLALARRGRDQALDAAELDLSPRPGVCRQGLSGARSVCAHLGGPGAAQRRVRGERGRENEHPGPDRAATRPCHLRRAVRSASSSSTSGAARSPTSPPGMSIGPSFSGAASRRPGSRRSPASSTR